MKTILLVLALTLIIATGLLYNLDVPEIKPYKGYLWILIAISFGLFSFIFLLKDSNNQDNQEKAK